MTSCFSLAGSAACPDLQANSVAVTASYASVADFDQYIMSSMFNNSQAVTNFQSTYDCPAFTGHDIRFEQSIACHYAVAASGCTQSAQYTPLCQSSCFDYIQTTQWLFINASVCNQSPSSTASSARTMFSTPSTDGTNLANTNPIFDACFMYFNTNDTTKCTLGLTNESANAGFLFSSDAMTFCSSTLLSTTDKTLCASVMVASASSNATGLAALTTAQKLAILLPARDYPWIDSGIAWAVMTGFAILWMAFLKLERWERVANAAFQPVGESKVPERYRPNEEFEAVGVKNFGTIARGRATIRRMEKGDYQPDEEFIDDRRKSIFESMFGSATRQLSFKREMRKSKRGESHVTAFESGVGTGGAGFKSKSGKFRESNYSVLESTADSANLIVKMQVISQYVAREDDEMSLKFGDIIIIEESFDDGWCLASNPSTGASGVVPMSCLAAAGTKRTAKKQTQLSSRVSSATGRSVRY
ncbi:hypothetical protein HDU83_005334 [Entophlyctis luteolus]|nr:hypothetical protein HDU83_005334 [Entophlyctis luteolus]